MHFKKLFCLITFFLTLNIGSTWAEDYTVSSVSDLQDALSSASGNGENNTIIIEPGTYFLNSQLNYISPGKTNLTISGVSADSVILDGNGDNQILHIETTQSSDQNSTEIQLLNLTFQNGNNSGNGGAVSINAPYAKVIIKRSKFSNNHADNSNGGGLYVDAMYGDTFVEENTFSENSSKNGGGFYVNCDYRSRYVDIYVRNNIIIDNEAENGGGGWIGGHTSKSIFLTNNTCMENTASSNGGGFYLLIKAGAEAYVFNNIIYSNAAVSAGGDIYFYDFGSSAFFQISNNNFSDYDFYNRDMELQDINIDQIPSLNADYHLLNNSVCINAGENNPWGGLPQYDFDGDMRILEGSVDIGADEYSTGILSYTVTFTEAQNGIINGPKTQEVEQGSNCQQVAAIPNMGYVFSGWTGDYTGKETILTVRNVSVDMKIVANFAEVETDDIEIDSKDSGGGGGGCFIGCMF